MKLVNFLKKNKKIEYLYVDQIIDDIAIILVDKEIYFYASIDDECEILEGYYYSIKSVSTAEHMEKVAEEKIKDDIGIERIYIDLKYKENMEYCLDIADRYIVIDCKINLELTRNKIKAIRMLQLKYQLGSNYIEYFRQKIENSELKEWNEYLTALHLCIKNGEKIPKSDMIKQKTIKYFQDNMQEIIEDLNFGQENIDVRGVFRKIYEINREKEKVQISLETLSIILHAIAPRVFTLYTKDNYSLLIKLGAISTYKDTVEKYFYYNEFMINRFIWFSDVFKEKFWLRKKKKRNIQKSVLGVNEKKFKKSYSMTEFINENIIRKFSLLTKKFHYEDFLYENL